MDWTARCGWLVLRAHSGSSLLSGRRPLFIVCDKPIPDESLRSGPDSVPPQLQASGGGAVHTGCVHRRSVR